MKAATAVLLLAFASAAFAASKEPFISFRYIDSQLSVANQHAAELKTSTDAKARLKAKREMRTALARIRQRCHKLKTVYRARGSRYGIEMFTELDRDTAAAEQALTSVRHKSPASEAKLEKAMLALVLRYQSLSANYGANHCQPRQWACCEPKRDPETNRESSQGCRWVCVSKTRSCSGFLGPRTWK